MRWEKDESKTYVDGGESADPRRDFHCEAVEAFQYSSGQGKARFVASVLLMYGGVLNRAGYWESKI